MLRKCLACHERIYLARNGWVHLHSGDTYCGCGDGSVAEPRKRCPNCSSLWNTSGIPGRKHLGCFSCLYQWWTLERVA